RRGEERRDEKKRLDHLIQDQTMLVIKRFSKRKKVFRERKKTGKSHAKRRIFYNHISHYLSNSQKEMDHQYPIIAKIHVLDTGKFEQWQFRIQQYLQHEHYAPWEKKKNDVKARTTLLLFLPDEHQLRFSTYKTAKELWATILKTFGGNEATKKRKKNLLKQQYGNFKAEGTETLELTFNRLQVIVSQLQFMDVEVKKDDLNQKFLTSLAPEWLMHTIVWRNRNDLDSMSLDDLYNHLKVFEAEVQKKSNSNSQDMEFISSSKNNSNEDDNTVCVTAASSTFPTGSVNVATISQDTASAFIASQSDDKFWKRTRKKISIQGSDVAGFDKSKVECFSCHKMGHFARECRAPRSQERGRKESYRQGSKAKEKSSKALMAIDGMGWDWSYMANEEDHALVADEETPTEFALMDNIENKVFDNSLCFKDCKKNTDSLNSKINDLKNQLSEDNNYWYHYKLGVTQLEERLNEYKEREENYIVKIRTLEMYRESNLDIIKILTNEVETLKEEKDVVDGKLAQLLKSSKDIEAIIESQRPSPTVVSTSAEDQNKDTSTSEDVASPNPPKPFVKSRVQRETNRSQNHSYKSSTHRSAGHRPNGAHVRPSLRSSGPRPHGDSMRSSFRPAGHKP
nr:hypothetical protein [Tanacetum cinerariifolium]